MKAKAKEKYDGHRSSTYRRRELSASDTLEVGELVVWLSWLEDRSRTSFKVRLIILTLFFLKTLEKLANATYIMERAPCEDDGVLLHEMFGTVRN